MGASTAVGNKLVLTGNVTFSANDTESQMNGGLEFVHSTTLPEPEVSIWTNFFKYWRVFLLIVIDSLYIIGFYIDCLRGRAEIIDESMPIVIYKAVADAKSTSSACSICFEDYNFGEKLRVLPCHHNFHASCLDPWLISSRRICPVCKLDVSICMRNICQDEKQEEMIGEIITEFTYRAFLSMQCHLIFDQFVSLAIHYGPEKFLCLCGFWWFPLILCLVASIQSSYRPLQIVLKLRKLCNEMDALRLVDGTFAQRVKIWCFSVGTLYLAMILYLATVLILINNGG